MYRIQRVRRGAEVHKQRYLGPARLFFAVADPTRIKILLYLSRSGEVCVSDLAEELGIGLAAISYHLRILQECRCLKTVRMRKMICYQFVPNPFTKLVLSFLKKEPTL